MTLPLICPVCGAPLEPQGEMLGCENGHPFNIAKEGYINLLLSHQRKSKAPGDDADMLRARRRFFDTGAFAPLTEAMVHHPLFDRDALSVLDCGCGEGHLLGALSAHRNGFFCGADIAKKAVQMASKRHKDATWIVANGMRQLPIAAASMDVVLSVLGPRNNDEFARVLKPDGKLLIGVPGPHHLIELRDQLQFSAGDFAEKADEAAAKCAPRFVEAGRTAIQHEATLDREQIADIIQMTPIFWRSSAAAKAAVAELEELTVTISFILLEMHRR